MTDSRIDIADLVRRSQAMARENGFAAAGLAQAGLGGAPPGDGALREVTAFGSNPGQVRMLEFIPDGLPPGAPLVVALHGCTQSAGGYDRGCGWSDLATRRGFALLLPEQRAANNANRCFNWFEPGDTGRDQGEAASIRQMVAHMVARHRLDPRRVFVTGLSAGGAMTASLLATYPEVFAAGAILAGLPHGAARSMPEAFEAMATGRPRPAAGWAEAVREASPHAGPWPRVAVWHGDADTTVRPVNAQQILLQWRSLHGLEAAAEAGQTLGPTHRAEVWNGPDGRARVEHHAIAGMPHGVPIGGGIGEAAPFILDVGISSTVAIAGFFGLDADARPAAQKAPRPAAEPAAAPIRSRGVIAVGADGTARPAAAASPPPPPEAPASAPRGKLGQWLAGVLPQRAPEAAAPAAEPAPEPRGRRIDPGEVIRRALRAAGLLDR
ncbi:MAG: alpha/beta hydrolase family esterase [Paracraurococcus sp.]